MATVASRVEYLAVESLTYADLLKVDENGGKSRRLYIILVFASSSNGYKPTSATIIGSGVRYIEIVLCRMRAEAPR